MPLLPYKTNAIQKGRSMPCFQHPQFQPHGVRLLCQRKDRSPIILLWHNPFLFKMWNGDSYFRNSCVIWVKLNGCNRQSVVYFPCMLNAVLYPFSRSSKLFCQVVINKIRQLALLSSHQSLGILLLPCIDKDESQLNPLTGSCRMVSRFVSMFNISMSQIYYFTILHVCSYAFCWPMQLHFSPMHLSSWLFLPSSFKWIVTLLKHTKKKNILNFPIFCFLGVKSTFSGTLNVVSSISPLPKYCSMNVSFSLLQIKYQYGEQFLRMMCLPLVRKGINAVSTISVGVLWSNAPLMTNVSVLDCRHFDRQKGWV